MAAVEGVGDTQDGGEFVDAQAVAPRESGVGAVGRLGVGAAVIAGDERREV